MSIYNENSEIECHSIPVLKTKEKSAIENQIFKWWQKVEQRSITLALQYNHVLHLDISDCYGSLYTHSIVWALHGKKKAKENRRNNELIGNVIDRCIQNMSNGQTNGIPQGSILMDFIAEIVLGYADLKLARKLKSCKECKTDYKIIRYRDDYRIFTNNSQQSSIIAKNLSKVLSDLNFKVNSQKTIDSNDLILGALKPDKIHWIYNKRKTENIQKWVLQMYELGRKFPNSGTLFREIDRFLKWLENTNTNTNTKVLISILVNLVYNNPRCFSVVMLSICFLITKIKKEEREDIIIIIKKV